MARVKSSHDELLEILYRDAKAYKAAVADMALAEVRNDFPAKAAARRRLERIVAGSMALSDMLGRRRLILESKALAEQNENLATIRADVELRQAGVLPSVSFDEAINSLLSRTPQLAENIKQIREAYRRQGFAVAQATDIEVTTKVQQKIAASMREGRTVPAAIESIKKAFGDSADRITDAYAETVYRTNVSRAYTAGRFEQANDASVAKVIGAFEYTATLDADTRPNHRKLHGLTAATNDPVWNDVSPPLGFNCRCDLILVDKFDLKDRGIMLADGRVRPAKIPAGAGPDEGFVTGNPARTIYG